MSTSPAANNPSPPPKITLTTRTDKSKRMSLLHHLLRPVKSHVIKLKDNLPAGSPPLTAPKSIHSKLHIQSRLVSEIHIYDLTPLSSPSPSPLKRIYYFAGGGWRMPASDEHWSLLAALLLQLPDTTISLISYPLAPASPAPDTFPRLLSLYTTLLNSSQQANETVILAGDSAGGNIVLCLALAAAAAKDPQMPVPAAVMAVCPTTDMQHGNPASREVERRDPLLTLRFVSENARLWCGEWGVGDERLSPLLSKGLRELGRRGVKVHGLTAGWDLLGPDARGFRDRLEGEGVSGSWLEWEGQMHCFPLTVGFGLPEAKGAVEWMGEVLRAV